MTGKDARKCLAAHRKDNVSVKVEKPLGLEKIKLFWGLVTTIESKINTCIAGKVVRPTRESGPARIRDRRNGRGEGIQTPDSGQYSETRRGKQLEYGSSG